MSLCKGECIRDCLRTIYEGTPWAYHVVLRDSMYRGGAMEEYRSVPSPILLCTLTTTAPLADHYSSAKWPLLLHSLTTIGRIALHLQRVLSISLRWDAMLPRKVALISISWHSVRGRKRGRIWRTQNIFINLWAREVVKEAISLHTNVIHLRSKQ